MVKAREGSDVLAWDGRRVLRENQRVGVGRVSNHQHLQANVA